MCKLSWQIGMSNEFFPAREDLGSRGRSEIYAFNFPQFIPALPFLLGLLMYSSTIRKLSLLFETLIMMGVGVGKRGHVS